MEDKTIKQIKGSYEPDTRKYIGQQCQDEKVNTAFRNLHKRIVDEIIGFCNAWNISIDEFHIKADGLAESIPHGSWQSCTDSSFVFKKYSDDYKKTFIETDKKYMTRDLKMMELNEEPFMYSM